MKSSAIWEVKSAKNLHSYSYTQSRVLGSISHQSPTTTFHKPAMSASTRVSHSRVDCDCAHRADSLVVLKEEVCHKESDQAKQCDDAHRYAVSALSHGL